MGCWNINPGQQLICSNQALTQTLRFSNAQIAPLTMAGFNPARSLGPRLVSWFAGWKSVAFQKWWVYVLAPIVGASAGAFLADNVLYAND